MLKPGIYERLPQFVEAMRVVPDALEDIAQWCGGEALTLHVMIPYMDGRKYVPVGDWVVEVSAGNFVHYSHTAFVQSFRFHSLKKEHYNGTSA